MAAAVFQVFITDNEGNVVPNASVEVRQMSPGFPLATVYSDREASNVYFPVVADSDGFVRFFAPGGAYRITATSGSFSRTFDYVAIGTAAERDAGSAISFDAATKQEVKTRAQGKTVTPEVLFAPMESFSGSTSSASGGESFTPDMDNGAKQIVPISDDTEIQLPVNCFAGAEMVLYVRIDVSSDPTVSFAAGFMGASQTLPTVDSSEDSFTRLHLDVISVDGSNNATEVWVSAAGSDFGAP